MVAALVFAFRMPRIWAMIAADLGGGVELALALAALGGEVPHQVFVGVAEDVVALGAVLGEVEGRVLEDGDQVGEPVDHLLAVAELGGVIEVGEVGELLALASGAMIFLLIWSPMSLLPLRATMSLKLAPGGTVICA